MCRIEDDLGFQEICGHRNMSSRPLDRSTANAASGSFLLETECSTPTASPR
jgi:hypothetical protein